MPGFDYPYAPQSQAQSPIGSDGSPDALKSLRAPSLALLILSSVSILVGILDVVLLVLSPPENPTEFVQSITVIGSAIANGFVFYGAICMRRGEEYNLAWTAAVVSAIPCLSACIWFGIPFGIWALIILRRPAVSAAFQS